MRFFLLSAVTFLVALSAYGKSDGLKVGQELNLLTHDAGNDRIVAVAVESGNFFAIHCSKSALANYYRPTEAFLVSPNANGALLLSANENFRAGRAGIAVAPYTQLSVQAADAICTKPNGAYVLQVKELSRGKTTLEFGPST